MKKNKTGEDVSDFVPAGRVARSAVAAKAGLKVGSNYARYLARRAVKSEDADSSRSRLNTENAEDLFGQLVKLRGTALKLAQGMSLEPGLLPKEFGEILSKAQYQVPPMGYGLVRRLVRQNLGDYPEKVFATFEPEAVAAASLGQVHRATMHDGTIVAVKVQYPNVRESIDSDLKMARGIAERIVGKDVVQPFLDEVRDRVKEETDYLMEGENIELFHQLYTSNDVVTPRWIPELTTEGVLTMTFIEGLHLKPFLATNPPQDQLNSFGQIFFDFVHSQITADSLAVHADAHPGNFLFCEDGRIGVLDFGLVVRFPRAFRDRLMHLFKARLSGDRNALMASYREMELLRPEMNDGMQAFIIDVLEEFGLMLATIYREDHFDFGAQETLQGYDEVLAKLTGREAFAHRGAIGTPELIFLSRLLAGFLAMMSQLGARVNVTSGRQAMLRVIEG